MRLSRTGLLRSLLSLAFVLAIITPMHALAATGGPQTATVVGRVVDQQSALPIQNATVDLLQDGKVMATSRTDAYGNFSIAAVTPGVYDVVVRAKNYAASTNLHVPIQSGATVSLNAAMIKAQTSSSNVRSLGTVTISATSLASATAITQTVSIQNVVQTGQTRFAQQLAWLPAINLSTSSSPGDDVSIDIRGFGASETATLLDSRPVGPLGVDAPDTYNYSNSPISSLDNVDVTYGSGAQGLYGSDTLAGAVNMHLLSYTARPQAAFTQQVGSYGLLSTAADISGTNDKLSYVVEAGKDGQTGQFNNNLIFQSARPALLAPGSVNPLFVCGNSSGLDVTSCNQAAETYSIGQQYNIATELARLRYALSSTTALAVSGYSSSQYANSTGNGDNDNLPYATRLGQIEQTSPNCSRTPGSPTLLTGYIVVVDPVAYAANPNTGVACYTAQQWAAVSYGPDGGGAGRQRGSYMQDYDARLTSAWGKNNIVVDTYVNNYNYNKSSSLSGGINAQGQLLGTPVFNDNYFTHAYLISDEIPTVNNDLAFGYALIDQLQNGNQVVATGVTYPNGESQLAFAPAFNAAIYRTDSWFVRDNHDFGNQLSGFLNAWVKHSNVTEQTTFDPRVSLQDRPDANDVLRLTYGHSDGVPAPVLKSTAPVFAANPGSSLTSVGCVPGSNSVASGGNPNLTSESANDYEFGWGHKFTQDSNIQVNAYVTSVAQELFGATQPLLSYGVGNVTFENGTLNNYLTHLILQGCLPAGSTTADTYPFLGVSTTYNLANELARGIDLNGRGRVTPNFYIDYGYSIESSQQFNVPDQILMNNLTIINGTQQLGLPLHQATLSLDYQPAGFEIRLDNYYVDGNNSLDRPAYITSNFFISHAFEKGKALLTLGGSNIFNQAVQTYGYIGSGVPVATNSFAPPAPFSGLGQNLAGINTNEQFGLTPAYLTLTLTVHT